MPDTGNASPPATYGQEATVDKKSSSNVRRAGEILLALGAGGQAGLSLAALAEATGDAKSAVHRALISLAEFGFVDQVGRRGNYRLGPAIYALAGRTPMIGEMVGAFRPALMAITAETGLSSYLMVRAGLDTVCLDFHTGELMAGALVEGVGGRLPLGVGVAGSALLARMDEATRERILLLNQPRYETWGMDPAVIRAEIDSFRRQGYIIAPRSLGGVSNVTLAVVIEGGKWSSWEAAISVLSTPDHLNLKNGASYARTVRNALRQDGIGLPIVSAYGTD